MEIYRYNVGTLDDISCMNLPDEDLNRLEKFNLLIQLQGFFLDLYTYGNGDIVAYLDTDENGEVNVCAIHQLKMNVDALIVEFMTEMKEWKLKNSN